MLVGNWIFALAFFLAFKFAWHWVPAEWNTPGDKIALVFQCAVFALLPGVVAICIVAAQRLNPDMWVGRTAKPNSALDINTQFILNTFEQFTAYLMAIAVVALYSPPEGARALPILTALFVLGRILFWVGYHKHPYLRAFGFGITFYPTVAIYIWFVLLILFSAFGYLCSNRVGNHQSPNPRPPIDNTQCAFNSTIRSRGDVGNEEPWAGE